MSEIITGIDIGSSSVKLAVGERDKDNFMNIICTAEIPSEGINKGNVTSIDDASFVFSRLLDQAEKILGESIPGAYIGINGLHIISQNSHGIVSVSRSDGEIKEDDVDRVQSSAEAIASPQNYTIMETIPQRYIVDGQSVVKDPVGMNGSRLELDAHIIQALKNQNNNIISSVMKSNIEVYDSVFSPIATSEAILDKKQKDLGVCLVNIGQSLTTMVVYENDTLLDTSVLSIGSRHITGDLAICLTESVDIAEMIKIKYGIGKGSKIIDKDEMIDLSQFNPEIEQKVSKRNVVRIMEARVEEIFRMVNKELIKINKDSKLPVGLVLTGGGAKLDGIAEVAKRVCKLPVTIGSVNSVNSVMDKIYDPIYSTAIGLVLYGDKKQQGEFGSSAFNSRGLSNIFSNFKSFFNKFF
ncbi:MAG: cell division protein FtsA [Spirochaetia bacterium]|nr:cell division protein FtsA [Spirochaetia bacterium]